MGQEFKGGELTLESQYDFNYDRCPCCGSILKPKKKHLKLINNLKEKELLEIKRSELESIIANSKDLTRKDLVKVSQELDVLINNFISR